MLNKRISSVCKVFPLQLNLKPPPQDILSLYNSYSVHCNFIPIFQIPLSEILFHTFKWISAEEKSLLYTTKLYCIDDLFCCWEYDLLTMGISTEYNVCFCCGYCSLTSFIKYKFIDINFPGFCKIHSSQDM